MQSQIFLGINAELDETGVLSAMCIGLFFFLLEPSVYWTWIGRHVNKRS
jgi:hypothetical protein